MPEPCAAAVSDRAVAEFRTAGGPPEPRPVWVVIAAFNEVGAIGGVVTGLPSSVSGRGLHCLVVDDGSDDGTAGAAEAAGALVCRLPHNLGQGWALRTGYRVATHCGAEVIVTMDGDGQFDPADLASLVEPVFSGRADMVVGSRRLGRAETHDRARAAGVVFFGRLVTALTGTKVTDPSNGFRAFRPEVARAVPLRQAQYQAAELLIGAIGAGFSVVEAPVVVRERAAGQSKKGTNLLYGFRFARVVVTTWWSARRSAR